MKKYFPFLLIAFSFFDINYFKYINISNIIVFLTILFGFTTTSYTIVIFHPIARKLYAQRFEDYRQLLHLFKVYRRSFSVQLVTILYLLLIEKFDLYALQLEEIIDIFFVCNNFYFVFKYIVFLIFFSLIALNIYNLNKLITILENISIAVAKNMFSTRECPHQSE